MSESLSPLPDDVRAALDAAGAPAPPDGFEEALFSKVATTLATLAPVVPPVASPSHTVATLAVKKSTLVLGALLVFGSGLGGGVLLAPSRAPVAGPPPILSVPEGAAGGASLQPSPTPSGPSSARPEEPKASRAPPKPPQPTRDTQLSIERALLEVARSALVRGDLAGALAAVERHAHDFPAGRLEEEREVLFIQALAQSGRQDEAAWHAADFRRRFPDSLMLPAVDASMAP